MREFKSNLLFLFIYIYLMNQKKRRTNLQNIFDQLKFKSISNSRILIKKVKK